MILFAVLGFFVIMILSSMWKGYVFSVLWKWFIVSTFGLPAISIPIAIGVGMLVGMLTHQSTHTSNDSSGVGERIATAAMLAFFLPLITLGIASIVKTFI